MKLFLAIIATFLLQLTQAFSGEPKCSFTQYCVRDGGQSPKDPCPDPSNSYTPMPDIGVPKKPVNSIKYLEQACPNMVGQEVCCNDDQILVMYNNFKTIDSLFGNCLICSINLKRFWCEYTCNPYQYYFLDSFEQIHVDDVDYLVLNQTMRISNDIACDIFKSCNKNPFVATLASGQSAPGFLEFMGSNAVQSGKVKISFTFDNDPEKSLVDEMYPCDMQVNGTLEGYYVEPCTCNYCEPSCKPSEANTYPRFFDGFNYVIVIIVYVSLIVLSVIIYFIKRKWQKPDYEEDVNNNPSIGPGNDDLINSFRSTSEDKQRLLDDAESSMFDKSNAKINNSSLLDGDSRRVDRSEG
jgi:hypothetical protein